MPLLRWLRIPAAFAAGVAAAGADAAAFAGVAGVAAGAAGAAARNAARSRRHAGCYVLPVACPQPFRPHQYRSQSLFRVC